MGTLFTLTDDIKNIANAAITDLINELGKTARLIYPPKMVACGCTVDPIGHKQGNKWITSGNGPINAMNNCVLCGGTGYQAQNYTEDITVLVAWQPGDFYIKVPNIQIATGVIQTKTFMTNLQKILQAKEMILQPNLTNTRWRYILDNDPTDPGNIVQDTFIVCQWRRAGG